MPTRIVFDFAGEAQVDRQLLRFAGRARDARPAFREMARRFAPAEGRQFDSQGAYGSGPWKPLSPEYAAWKERHYPGRKIMQRTGALKRDLTERPFGVEVIEPSHMVLGTNRSYAKYHQRGGSTPGRPPQRKLVDLPETERQEWVRILQRHIVEGEL